MEHLSIAFIVTFIVTYTTWQEFFKNMLRIQSSSEMNRNCSTLLIYNQSYFTTLEQSPLRKQSFIKYQYSTMTSVQDTLNQINSVLKEVPNIGRYTSYSCKTVSWDDVQRGTVGGELSCWGANITDTRFHAIDGRQLFTMRGADKWNERLGKVLKADDLALIASDVNGGGTGEQTNN